MKYVCQVCGYIYDESVEKIAFADLPDDWKCPLCGAPKSQFKPEESEKTKAVPEKKSSAAETGKRTGAVAENGQRAGAGSVAMGNTTSEKAGGEIALTIGQLSALCSNLARGCEKQYKDEEARMFREIADYFKKVTPEEEDATVEKVAKLLQEDIDNYPSVRETADGESDRGAARVCVWGEKVTRMLSSLVSRYKTEGEKMLAGTNVWVCTVCGFVYIGEKAPELCPVCKVPSWKFEKVEGGVR